MDLNLLQAGDIVLVSNNKPKGVRIIFDAAIKFFTKSPWTHGAVIIGNVVGVPAIFEADEEVITDSADDTINNPDYDVAVYRYVGIRSHVAITEEQNITVLGSLFRELAGKGYGYLQIIYYIRRWFWTRPFVSKYFGWVLDLVGKSGDPRNWNNWFVGGVLCTELVYKHLAAQGNIVGDSTLLSWLGLWNSNNFSPADLQDTMDKFPDKYKLIYTNKKA